MASHPGHVPDAIASCQLLSCAGTLHKAVTAVVLNSRPLIDLWAFVYRRVLDDELS